MPPPSEYLLKTWNKYLPQSSELQQKWGAEFPVDSRGFSNPDAISDLISLSEGKPIVTAETQQPQAPTATAVDDRYGRPEDMTWAQTHLTGVADTGAAAVAPEEVDWGDRLGDFGAGLLQLGMGIPYEAPIIGKYLPGHEIVESRQREAREKIDPELGGFKKFLAKTGAGLSPILGGFKAWTDTVQPGAALLNSIWEPGIRRRAGELRDQGYGPMESMQAAYQQASEAGELAGIQQLLTEVVTDPVELIPGVGIYGAVAKTGAKASARAAAKAAGKEAPEVVAKDIQEKLAGTAGRTIVDLEGIDKPIVVGKEASEYVTEYSEDVVTGRQHPEWEQGHATALDLDPSDVNWEKASTTERQAFVDKYADKLDAGYSLQMQMQAHPLDELIRSADQALLEGTKAQKSVRANINSMFHYKNQEVNSFVKSQYNKNLDEAARKIFGESNLNTRNRVEEYIDYFDNAADEYVTNVQGLLDRIPGQGTEEAGRLSNWYFMPNPNDPSKMIVRVNRPLGPSKVYLGVEKESQLSKFINEKAMGSTSAEVEAGASSWVKDLKPNFFGVSIYDGIRTITREVIGSHRIPGQTEFQNAVQRLFGVMNTQGDYLQDVIRKGSEELEKLGYGTRRKGVGKDNPLLPTKDSVGSWETPGSVRYLYRALHGDAAALEHIRQIGWEQQYYNLKSFTNWEEELRILNNQIADSAMDIDDYFHRGWKAQEGLHEKAQLKLKETIARLGGKEAFQKGRANLSYADLEELGFEPLYWNPYEQAMFSARMGTRQRLQIELVNMMMRPELDLIKKVDSQEQLALLIKDGYKSLDTIEMYKPALREFNSAMADVNPAVAGKVTIREQYMLPEKVAKSLENLFGGPRAKAMTKERVLKMRGNELLHFKLDDLVYIPKRIKLFGSLFQQADFAQRTAFGGSGAFLYHVLMGLKMAATPGTTGTGLVEIGKSFEHLARMPQGWINMARANFSPRYRENIAAMLKSDAPLWPDHPDPLMREISFSKLRKNGLSVIDQTIFNKEELLESMAKTKKDFADSKSAIRWIKEIEFAMQRGLFDGVYPAAIMHDVQYNLLPVLRMAHPEMTADQLMTLVAHQANKAWSTIPIEQSVVQGFWRDLTTRGAFSVAENEGLARSAMGMVRGPNKAYWQTRWAGGFLFIAGVANLIHYVHTGESLPTRRYIPMTAPNEHQDFYRYGYNTAFLSPDIGVPTVGGEAAMLDLMMQADFIGRMFDMGYEGVPGWNFIESRASVPVRTALNQLKGTDYHGRDIAQTGFVQRLIQLGYDSLAPIGAGQLAIAATQKAFEDKQISMPGVEQGSTVKDIMPSAEERLGFAGVAIQGLTGLNLRAKSNPELEDEAVANTFKEGTHSKHPGESYTNRKQIENDPDKRRLVYEDPKNVDIFAEIDRRRELGLRYGTASKFSEMMNMKSEASSEKIEKQSLVVNKYAGMLWNPDGAAWEPTSFGDALRKVSREYRTSLNKIDDIYGLDPDIKNALEDMKTEPNRSQGELKWAIWKFYNMRKEYTDKLGEVDFDAFDKAWDEETDEWESDMLVDRLEAYLRGSNNHPLVQLRYDAFKTIDESGYWETNFPREMSGLTRLYADAPQIWEDYLNAGKQTRLAMKGRKGTNSYNVIRVMENAQDTNKRNVRLKNPEVDALIVFWLGYNPVRMENTGLWQRLYSTQKYPRTVKLSR